MKPEQRLLEDYLTELRDAHRTGAGTGERTYYPAVNNLLNAIGGLEAPRTPHLRLGQHSRGQHCAGIRISACTPQPAPEGRAPQRPEPRARRDRDEAGADNAWLTAKSDQVSKYFEAYRLVIATNLRDFLIVGAEPESGRSGMTVSASGDRVC